MAPQVRSAEHSSFPLAKTVPSPNGQHAIHIRSTAKIHPGDERKWWEAILRILDQAGKSIYEDSESYALWFRFQVRWINDSTIELISGDVGKRMYTMTDGAWGRHP